MPPQKSLDRAQDDRRREEAKTPRAGAATARIEQARDEDDLAQLFRRAFNAGR